MTIQPRCPARKLGSGAGVWLFLILVIAPPSDSIAGESTNWLQLRRLNTENQFTLKQQQQMLRPKAATKGTDNSDFPLDSSKRQKIILPKIAPAERPLDYYSLEHSQRMEQRRLQESQRRQQIFAKQRSRLNGSMDSESYRPNFQLQRFRQQQRYQLNRMRTQSLLLHGRRR